MMNLDHEIAFRLLALRKYGSPRTSFYARDHVTFIAKHGVRTVQLEAFTSPEVDRAKIELQLHRPAM